MQALYTKYRLKMKLILTSCLFVNIFGISYGNHRAQGQGLGLDIGHRGKGHDVHPNVCPKMKCGFGDRIPDECRKPRYVIGYDGKTRCRMCDESFCGNTTDVCPLVKCPDTELIPLECRKPNYIIGSDGITRCRVCDSTVCGDPAVVCPSMQTICPLEHLIPGDCRVAQYGIGSDGITLCKLCSKMACPGVSHGHNHVH